MSDPTVADWLISEAALKVAAKVHAKHYIEATGPGEVSCRGCRERGWMSHHEYGTHLCLAILDALMAANLEARAETTR